MHPLVMAVRSWTSDVVGVEGESLIRRCFSRINLVIDEEISNSHQLDALDQGPGKLVKAQRVSVLASCLPNSSNSYQFEVRSAESSLLRESRCHQVATALQAELQDFTP